MHANHTYFRRTFVFFTAANLFSFQIQDIWDRIAGKSAPVQTDRLTTAVLDTLQLGLRNAVFQASQTDGYFGNLLIRILLPDDMRRIDKTLRFFGAGKLVDDFILAMNRAAEKAAPLATPIFLDAMGKITIPDAARIIRGSDTAATDYFKTTTREPLAAAFKPCVSQALKNVGAVTALTRMLDRFQKIPFLRVEPFDLDRYVTGKAVDGIFHLIGREEKEIRRNPAGRVSPVLREVFGGH